MPAAYMQMHLKNTFTEEAVSMNRNQTAPGSSLIMVHTNYSQEKSDLL